MKFVRVEEWLRPEYRDQARRNIQFHEHELRDVCAGMRHYVRSKEEFIAWVDEVYEAEDDAYQDWLSTR